MATYRELDVYKRSYKLALEIYQLTLKLPQGLQYDITDDLRRAARSIPSNIAEGYGRNKSKKDIASFLKISLGSCDEVLFNLSFLRDLELLSEVDYDHLSQEYETCGKQLNRLLASLNQPTRQPEN